MKNLFDIDSYPSSEPKTLAAGTRWTWKRPDISAAYSPDLYTLTYRITLMGSAPASISITANKVSSEHVVEESKANTTRFNSGEYSWAAIIIRDSDNAEIVIDEGFVSITPAANSEDNTQAGWIYQTLQAVRATINNTASQEQQNYSIAGRSLSRRSPEELMSLEREFSRRWKAEKEKVDRKSGRQTSRRVLVKMGA